MKVAGMTIDLEVPASLWRRQAILMAAHEAATSRQRAVQLCAAAMMLCCPTALRKPGAPTYSQDMIEYGEAVMDYLLPLGATLEEIVTAGNAAIEMVSASLVTAEQVEEAKGNSAAPTGA